MSFEQAAARLAGGFIRPIDDETLRATIQAVLPETPMGELENIKLLPGMIDSAAGTLYKAWRAVIDLGERADEHPRLESIARLEATVLEQLPSNMMRPVDIVQTAAGRIAHAPTVLGPMDIVGLSELAPCWRPLLKALAAHIPVRWTAGPGGDISWLKDTGASVSHAPAESPKISVVSAATSYHEAIEAMRWVRSLLVKGVAPSDIAIAAATPAEYDSHFLALREDANISLHFAYGVGAITTRDGQAAAALADIVVRGLSQSRLSRLARLCPDSAPFESLPEGWLSVLPASAPLSKLDAWSQLLNRLEPEHWPDGEDHVPALREAVELLASGTEAAPEIGEAFLKGRALAIWRRALLFRPAASIDATLEIMKHNDDSEACVSAVWMPASELAASPRRFVRLIGLNSSRWPRGITEDRLIPDHIIPTAELNPLPVSLADRRDFETILSTTSDEIILSHARRGSDGRLLGRSPLLAKHGEGGYFSRNAVPVHAFSESDRLMARPREFSAEPQAISARDCWIDWRKDEITAHDGLVRADHPIILEILSRIQSASSLRRLLRNPLEFVWVYAFKWREPKSRAEPLMLDAAETGDLTHMVLEHALRDLDSIGGSASSDTSTIESAVDRAVKLVSTDWESKNPVPPSVIWKRTLEDIGNLAYRAFARDGGLPSNGRSYAEVPFGGFEPESEAETPWDTGVPVTIPDTGFSIRGYIDRIDILNDGSCVIVRDYKTGRKAPRASMQMDGGRELQRCLYAFAVKALMGDDVPIRTSLFYLQKPVDLPLDKYEAVLEDMASYLRAARTSLVRGAALPGPDAGGRYDDLALALPANAGAIYCKRKLPPATKMLDKAAQVWDAP